MPERTHLTQPDEALRQVHAHTLHNLVGTTVARIADHLTKNDPSNGIVDATPTYLTYAYADRVSRSEATVLQVAEAVLRFLPAPRLTETRGEYALRIRAIAGRTHV